MRAGRCLVVLCVVLATLAGGAGAESALSREEALDRLGATDTFARRRSVESLGAVGRMDDVPALMRALADADEIVRHEAERAIWAVWSRSGDPEVDALFAQGAQQMANRELADSVQTFSRIIALKPDFAEGWNKRATARFLAGDLQGSLADCDEVMARNPMHFGALSGYGLIHSQLGNPELALDYFRRALAINPNMEGVRANIEAIRRELARKGRRET
mgnify:FL=1